MDCGRDVTDPAFRILISDEHGHLFAFCATRGNDYNGYGDSFVLGSLRPSRKLVRVELGTKSYQFLFSLLWSFSREPRYQCDHTTLERYRRSLGVSEDEFAELLEEPPLPKASVRAGQQASNKAAIPQQR